MWGWGPAQRKHFFFFFKLKFFYADLDPGSGIYLTLDPESGMEKFGSGIRDKHPGSATLFGTSDTVPCQIF